MPRDTDTAESLLGRIEETRTTLYELLRRSSASTDLARRPAPDAWSVIENVRHLL